jgi:hypothetical protein
MTFDAATRRKVVRGAERLVRSTGMSPARAVELVGLFAEEKQAQREKVQPSARTRAFREVQLSPEQQAVVADEDRRQFQAGESKFDATPKAGVFKLSDARSMPTTSIQSTRPNRGSAKGLQQGDTTLGGGVPGESFLATQLRIRGMLDKVQQSANVAANSARPVSQEANQFSEVQRQAKAERGNAERRAAALADPMERAAKMNEVASVPLSVAAGNLDLAKAHVIMRSRQQPVFTASELAHQKPAIRSEYSANLKAAFRTVAQESR